MSMPDMDGGRVMRTTTGDHGRSVDLTDKVMGEWTVLGRAPAPEKRPFAYRWECRCSCGRVSHIEQSSLMRGISTRCKSCANRARRGESVRDMTGRVFGRWTVLGFSHQDKPGRAYWLCRCACGVEKAVRGSAMRSGRSTGCIGCGIKHREKRDG